MASLRPDTDTSSSTTAIVQRAPGVGDLAPYVQGKSKIEGHPNPIKLSSNESNLGPSPRAIEAYEKASKSLFRYPDGSQYDLRNAIAEVFHLDENKIVCGNGSDELISLLMRAYLQSGDDVVISEFSFAMAKIHAIAQGANVIDAPEPDLNISTDIILDSLTDKTKMVVIANPNNPVGSYAPASEIKRLHENLPANVLLLLDSAYADYVIETDYNAGAYLVENNNNVVMTRTFSKLYGLASLRIGWAYCPNDILDSLQRIRTPFNTNGASLAAAEAAVRDVEYADYVRSFNHTWLQNLTTEIKALGYHVAPSVANFYLIKFPMEQGRDAEAAFQFLASKGIITRPVNAGGPIGHLRLTVGLEDENKAVISALTEFKDDF